jgi:pimeloyl-ACP methyl ester carboxylesterase
VYSLGGAGLLRRQLDLLLDGRRLLWSAMDRAARSLTDRKVPYRNESDLVSAIGFRELNFAGIPDGLPLDPAIAMREVFAGNVPDFESEPFDLVTVMPGFDWPTAIVSGGRDLTTPPAVAQLIAALIPAAALVLLPTAGHSMLDTREQAALLIAAEVCAGRTATLSACSDALDELAARPTMRATGAAVSAAARIEAALPRVFQRSIS